MFACFGRRPHLEPVRKAPDSSVAVAAASEPHVSNGQGQEGRVPDSSSRDPTSVATTHPGLLDAAALGYPHPVSIMHKQHDQPSTSLSCMHWQHACMQSSEVGPPKPPCDEDRVKTMQALGLMNAPPDPEITSILKLITSIFDAPNAFVSLFEDSRIVIKDSEGAFKVGDFPWRRSLCAWTLATPNPQLMVIPDTTKDARFSENPYVLGEPGLKFYAGSPLVASNGHRLGTLCFADNKPRQFDAMQYTILNNLSELVVRRLEKDLALQLSCRENTALAQQYRVMERALEVMNSCVALVDTKDPGFAVLYMTETWTKLTELPRDVATGRPMAELFAGPADGPLLTPASLAAAREGRSFAVPGVTLKAGLPTGKGAPATFGSLGGKAFVVRFRPATQDQLDVQAIPVGVPSYLPRGTTTVGTGAATPPPAAGSLYFASVELMPSFKSGSRSTIGTMREAYEAIDGLTLGQLLGRGAFGRVYAGKYHGAPVAIKLIEQQESIGQPDSFEEVNPITLNREAALAVQLRHPHITSVLAVHAFIVHSGNSNSSPLDADALTASSVAASSSANTYGSSGTALQSPPAEDAIGDALPPPLGPQQHVPLWAVINLGAGTESVLDSASGSATVSSEAALLCSSSYATASQGARRAESDPCSSGIASHAVGAGGPANSALGLAKATVRTCIVMEYCDCGCLQDAIDRGWLFDVRSCVRGKPRMDVVLARASEIANALCYLHARGVIHGDLTTCNVLLTSTGAADGPESCGFVAKVADFGLVRVLGDVRSKIQTRTYGTLTHQPPETLAQGIVSKAVDIYSLGVLLWQMYTGSRPWAGLSHAQILVVIVSEGRKLKFPAGTPGRYEALAMDCMASDPEQRPSAEEVWQRLQAMLEGGCE